jgi:hypothetical protein
MTLKLIDHLISFFLLTILLHTNLPTNELFSALGNVSTFLQVSFTNLRSPLPV